MNLWTSSSLPLFNHIDTSFFLHVDREQETGMRIASTNHAWACMVTQRRILPLKFKLERRAWKWSTPLYHTNDLKLWALEQDSMTEVPV